MTAVCVGCGCTDHAACVDLFGHGCAWVTVNHGKGLGVCSSCNEIERALGSSKPDLEFSKRRFAELLQDFYEPAAAAQWFDLPQKALGGKTPRELVAGGEIRKVRQVVDQLASGAYI